MNLVLAQYSKITKPLFQPLIHDESTRLVVIVIGLLLSIFALTKIIGHLHE